jgi:hypothetical protein
MHPIVARIHPALRTTLLAFLVGRGAFWLSRWIQGRDLATLTYGVGPWANTGTLVDLGNEVVPWVAGHFGTYSMIGLGELMVWLTALAIYKVIRREGLPQTADRAVWFWMCSPLISLLVPGSGLIFGGVLAVWALEFAGSNRAGWAGVLMALSAIIAPQTVVLFPGVAALSFRSSKDEITPWIATLLPILVMASWVLYGVLFGDAPRYVFDAFALRVDWVPAALLQSPLDIAQLTLGLVLLGLWTMNLKRLPRSFALTSLPAIVVLLIAPLGLQNMFPLLVAAPIWAHLALAGQDPEIERPLLGVSLLMLILAVA